MDVISAISGAITAVKGIASAMKATNDLKNASAVLDVQMTLFDVRQEVLALKEENEKLKAELAKMKENKPEVVLREGVYYKADNPDDGPFCTTCFDSGGKLIRVQGMGDVAAMTGIKFRCAICKALYR